MAPRSTAWWLCMLAQRFSQRWMLEPHRGGMVTRNATRWLCMPAQHFSPALGVRAAVVGHATRFFVF